jgi:hypothetical protein
VPSFTFCGCIPYDFPETRDEHGVIVGRVNPGDERDFAEAPTADWFPSDGPLPKRLPDPEPEAAESDAAPVATPAPALSFPVPSVPSVPPPADPPASED